MDYKGYKYAIKMSVYAHICAAMLIGRQRQVFLQCDAVVVAHGDGGRITAACPSCA